MLRTKHASHCSVSHMGMYVLLHTCPEIQLILSLCQLHQEASIVANRVPRAIKGKTAVGQLSLFALCAPRTACANPPVDAVNASTLSNPASSARQGNMTCHRDSKSSSLPVVDDPDDPYSRSHAVTTCLPFPDCTSCCIINP